MWKLLIISSVLSATLATRVEDIYGTWEQVAYYSYKSNRTICSTFTFERDPRNDECKCVDGEQLTELKFSGVVTERSKVTKRGSDVLPFLVVDSSEQIERGVNINCTCGDRRYTSAMVARSINENYFLMFEKHIVPGHSGPIIASIIVFAKELPSSVELSKTLQSIEELKDKPVASKCARDL